jgi:restriction endonuclease S subunit
LRSAVGQALLANKQTHGAVQTLPAQDLRELSIPIPSMEELHSVESKHRQVRELQAQIERLQAEIDQAQRALWG